MSYLNFDGVLIGVCTFAIIGIFHPLVIKGYYYFGLKCRWAFLLVGIITLAICLIVQNTILSILLGVTAFSCFWSILEVKEQQKRVAKGWFPDNPERRSK